MFKSMLCLVGHNRLELVEPFIQQWLPIDTRWIDHGVQPYIFPHAPDGVFGSEFPKRFWHRYCTFTGSSLPQRYGPCSIPTLPTPLQQMDLFEFIQRRRCDCGSKQQPTVKSLSLDVAS